MPQYIDIYLLSDCRRTSFIQEIIAEYLPSKTVAEDEYPVPLFSKKPKSIFKKIKEVMEYLEINKDEEYSLYWNSKDPLSTIMHAMAIYTDDKKMIFGFSICGYDAKDVKAISLYKEIKNRINSDVGCITVEEAPPYNSQEFACFAKARFIPE